MTARVNSGYIEGINGFPVEVEVDLSNKLKKFDIVGLPETSVKESLIRIESAIKNSGLYYTWKNITVNLAPADVRKSGTLYDLPIAVGILACSDVVPQSSLSKSLFLGEISLTGRLRPIPGVLPLAQMAKANGFPRVITSLSNAHEASIIEGIEVYGLSHLCEVVDLLNGREMQPFRQNGSENPETACDTDFSEVRGQARVKRALEIAAAGDHNVLMIGSPGSGKTMLARRIPTILPSMTFDESIETTKIYSVAGLLKRTNSLMMIRPFRAPHHTISDTALVGGGTIPRPGEVSLAHNGVLFLDELPEFRRTALEVLRQPMEDGKVLISRTRHSCIYPSNFMLIAAMNPCPCGYFGDARRSCICSVNSIVKYRNRISGPLLDRIDIQVEVPSVSFEHLRGSHPEETSGIIKKRVESSRQIQNERLKDYNLHANSRMETRHVQQFCRLDSECLDLLKYAVEKLGFSARAYARIIKVARTISDLEGKSDILPEHIAEAIQYRILDRKICE